MQQVSNQISPLPRLKYSNHINDRRRCLLTFCERQTRCQSVKHSAVETDLSASSKFQFQLNVGCNYFKYEDASLCIMVFPFILTLHAFPVYVYKASDQSDSNFQWNMQFQEHNVKSSGYFSTDAGGEKMLLQSDSSINTTSTGRRTDDDSIYDDISLPLLCFR